MQQKKRDLFTISTWLSWPYRLHPRSTSYPVRYNF